MAKKWIPTQEILARIEELAMKGVTEASIARQVGLHPSTFSEKKEEFPEVAEVIKRGQANGEEIAVGVIWSVMTDLTEKSGMRLGAAQFYLTHKCGWTKNTNPTETNSELPEFKVTFVKKKKLDE